MKAEFKAKFLHHLAQKHAQKHAQEDGESKGFTLVELLVVIIIIGILSAIALPSFLNQANKAKQSEAKQNVGSMNRAQTAYMAENSVFGSTVQVLGLGIQTQTVNYYYTIAPVAYVGEAYTQTVNSAAASLKGPLRSYMGGVALGTVQETSETTTLSVLCETKQVGKPDSTNFPAVTSNFITAGQCQADPNSGAYRLLNGK
ncbi:hypothetical protein BST81_08255 [Leptolyngbya sp. 'hensonii']|uniref:type IV pilin-like G/H family protein n=1 Tax=Leptolyngbya sp. 'hensonii' TaxID=1922337 RepID=UPI0009500677|nr:type IV pilin-like G/H family protein [Leptolyngbya sp. 'hensonii']OLP18898.1 hypothetical protein BST81_08255 [Leptolyngbya sp. 'hensonii']